MEEPTRTDGLLISCLQTWKNWLWMWRLRATLAAGTVKWWSPGSWDKGTRQIVESDLDLGGETLVCTKISFGESLAHGLGEKRDPWELVNFQEKLSSSSKTVHAALQEVRQKGEKSCMDEQRCSWQNPGIKRKHIRGGSNNRWLGRNIETSYKLSEILHKESQSPRGVEFGKSCQRQQEGFLFQQQKEDERICGSAVE